MDPSANVGANIVRLVGEVTAVEQMLVSFGEEVDSEEEKEIKPKMHSTAQLIKTTTQQLEGLSQRRIRDVIFESFHCKTCACLCIW